MKTVVFGIGDCWGKYLSTFSDMNVDFFCESNPQKDSFCGYPLIGIDALKKIDDNYPKYILTLDDDLDADFDGIKKINVLDWLLEDKK